MSLLVYTIITAIIGRDVLAHLGSTIANDAGDPLLTAAILKWNATHLPLTDAWYQFPIFYPTRDTLTFSEHLLGLSVIASPIYWLTGDIVITYNLVLLLTFPLCGIAMYALIVRLTGSAAGAFIAGLAFAFAPYRISQLPHIQMLADLLGAAGAARPARLPASPGDDGGWRCTARRGCCRVRPTGMPS